MVNIIWFAGKEFTLLCGPDNSIIAACPCNVLDGLVVVILTPEQANEIFYQERAKRRQMDEILPHVPRQVQEMFISGTTPAEWDVNVVGCNPRAKEYYVKLGYVFNDQEGFKFWQAVLGMENTK